MQGRMQNWLSGMSTRTIFVTNAPDTEAYSKPSQTSTMRLFWKLVNDYQQLTTFAKSSILDFWFGSECAFAVVLDKYQDQYGMEDFQ